MPRPAAGFSASRARLASGPKFPRGDRGVASCRLASGPCAPTGLAGDAPDGVRRRLSSLASQAVALARVASAALTADQARARTLR